jgi:hypothetical protein
VNRLIKFPLVSLVIIFLWVMGTCASNTKALTSPPLLMSRLMLSGMYVSDNVYATTGTNGGARWESSARVKLRFI